jgi:hypothetical protein
VVYTCNPSTQEAEEGVSRVQGQAGLLSQICFQKKQDCFVEPLPLKAKKSSVVESAGEFFTATERYHRASQQERVHLTMF